MLRPARLAVVVAFAMLTAAFAATPAFAGTTDLTISGCTVSAASTGTPPANVVVSPTSGRCTVNGINGTATTSGATLTSLPDGGIVVDRLTVTLRATVLIVPITCVYEVRGVLIPLQSAGPPTWTYYSASATATKVSGPSVCEPTVTGEVTIRVTP